jgi:hypothetical protein
VHSADGHAAIRDHHRRKGSIHTGKHSVTTNQKILHRLIRPMARDFKGHLDPGDPRDPLWAAGGATWPTIPPYNIIVGNPITHPIWLPLLNPGILMSPDQLTPYDDQTWTSVAQPSTWITSAWAWRHFDRSTMEVDWFVFFNTVFHPDPLQVWDTFTAPRAANVDVKIDNSGWPYGLPTPGDEIGIYQVLWDESTVPGGWPPWA